MSSKSVTMRCIKRVLWDNCMGQYVTAFDKGDVVVVAIYDNPTHPVCGTASSPYWRGISDFVPLNHFEELT
jgi:hypothetical protein